jgi:competence protein ComEA
MKKRFMAMAMGVLVSTSIFAANGHSPARINHATQQAAQSNHVISINRATVQQLAQLKGLGQKKARAIVNYRKQHGPFKGMGDLVQVKGVGKALLQRIHRRNPGKFRLS